MVITGDYCESKPGVLITEIQLRGMTGMELFEKLSAEKQDLPIAIISGYADVPTAIQGMQADRVISMAYAANRFTTAIPARTMAKRFL